MKKISSVFICGALGVALAFPGCANKQKQETRQKTVILEAEGREPKHETLGETEAEASGEQFTREQVSDQVAKGSHLVLAYNEDSRVFTGTVENVSDQVLDRIRVEVHLSNGTQLGPATQVDLQPGEKRLILLETTSGDFSSWSTHVEVGVGEHGHTHSHENGEHSHSHGDGEHSHSHENGEHSHSHGDREHSHSHGDGEHNHSHGDGEHNHSHGDAEHSHSHENGEHNHSHGDAEHSHSHGDAEHSHSHEGGGSPDPVQRLLDSLLNAQNLPGANLSVILSDQTIHQYSAGYADKEKQLKMTSEHVLFSGSIGKTYAVALLLQMLDQDLFSLDDRLADHFPDTPWLSRLPGMEQITIRMLLQHTSGLPEYVMQEATWDSIYNNPDKVWTYYDRMELIFDQESVHAPGDGWAYSDTNYILLGMLIEKLSQEAYYEVLSSRILEPENLGYTYATIRRDLEGLPQGYSELPGMFRMPGRVLENGNYVFNPQMEWTGGGLASRTSDLARWARLYYRGSLFSEALRKEVITPSKQGSDLDTSMSYGMGSFIYQTAFGPAYAHTGFVPGFNSIFAYYPELDVAVAFQTNCDFAARQMSLIDYLDLLLGKLLE